MIGQMLLKRYCVISFLGDGSTGSVYLARDRNESRIVVVKVMHPHVAADPAYRKFLQSEVESLTRLRHANVVELYDVSLAESDRPCLVMEFIPGVTLEALLKRHGRLPLAQAARLLNPLCRALDAGHAFGITHRDLKPANLMVIDPDTPRETLKVMDFGFSQQAARPHLSLDRLLGSNEFTTYGTPLYLPPECARGDEIDPRADLYSVGVILYELLTGTPPFNHREVEALVTAHMQEPPPRFASRWPGLQIPAEVEKVVRWCLSKFPIERPQSAKELLEAFSKASGLPFDPAGFAEARPLQPATSISDSPRPASWNDPAVLRESFDAWMPEPIAILKIRGFVDDHRGEIITSAPGHIYVRFRSTASEPAGKPVASLWTLLGGKPSLGKVATAPSEVIDMHLLLSKKGSVPSARIELQVIARRGDGGANGGNNDWRSRAHELLKNLSAYLMAK